MTIFTASLLPGFANNLLLLVAYLLLGIAVKYIDQAFDYRVFNKKIATAIAFPTAAVMGYLVVRDPYSASIFLAVALGVAVANKIDNIAFRIGIGTLILIPVFFSEYVTLLWLPFGVLFLGAVVDEFGNDWSDRHSKEKLKHHVQKKPFKQTDQQIIASYFFSHRSTMKILLLILALTNHMPPVYFVAFLLFDFGYGLTEKISFRIRPARLRNPRNHHKTPVKTPLEAEAPATPMEAATATT